MNTEIEDYKKLPLTKFIQKYPKYTLYLAHKTFWDKEKVDNYLTKKQLSAKKAQERLNRELEESKSKNDEILINKFNLSLEEIKTRLNKWFWYSELLQWEIINWKYVVENRILIVRNS